MQKEKMHLWFKVGFHSRYWTRSNHRRKRKQKVKSGFSTKQEAEEAAVTLIHELNQGTY